MRATSHITPCASHCSATGRRHQPMTGRTVAPSGDRFAVIQLERIHPPRATLSRPIFSAPDPGAGPGATAARRSGRPRPRAPSRPAAGKACRGEFRLRCVTSCPRNRGQSTPDRRDTRNAALTAPRRPPQPHLPPSHHRTPPHQNPATALYGAFADRPRPKTA